MIERSDIRRSSFCIRWECVEVEFTPASVFVNNGSQRVQFSHDEWRAFIAGVKNGEFEVPSDD